MPKVGLSLGSSFEKLFNKAPDPSKLHVFGCLYFPWLRPYSFHKLDQKSSPCVFLGYSLTHSDFLCFDTLLHKIFVSRHVKFVENVFSFVFPPTSIAPILDTVSALLALLCTFGDYPPPLTSSPSPHLTSRQATSPLLDRTRS